MTEPPKTEKVELDFSDGWLTVWFNTPENRNALSDELAGELRATLEAVQDNATVRGVTLRGRGGVFCAGGDLKGFQAALTGGLTHDAASTMNKAGGELFRLINEFPKVVVVLIEGATIAGGLGLACCADIVATTRDAKFALTETQLGIVPAQIAPHVIRRVGETAARRLMLTGARFDGEEAARLGVADFLVDDATDLDAVEADIRKAVRKCAPGANAATKKLVLASTHLNADEIIDRAADVFAGCITSDEGREGISAFVQKRKPNWAE